MPFRLRPWRVTIAIRFSMSSGALYESPSKSVEPTGLEPVTSGLQSQRSPN
jgi:hypothetical protein